jgi:5-(carboxyamino)imidazole ribonucleotide synthase
MLAIAGARLGLKAHVFAPEADNCAYDVAAERTIASYTDEVALGRFACAVDVVTYEFENVPAETVELLSALGADVAPGAKALAVAQDRVIEKEFARGVGAKTAPFRAVDDLPSLAEALAEIGRPAILKTRRLGYDGKGQTLIRDAPTNLGAAWEQANAKAWEEVGARPSILEGFVACEREISVIGARGRDGEVALYDPPENRHEGGILRRSSVPARITPELADEARRIASRLLTALDYVGVIGVEFFVPQDGGLLLNEFAPRVHNSGHWTLDACAVSQFEQHIRAICGWPLGDPARHSDAVMDNLIGDEAARWAELAGEAGLSVHLYGKGEVRQGRKMGHATRISMRKIAHGR